MLMFLIYAGSLVNPELIAKSGAPVKLDSWGMKREEIIAAMEDASQVRKNRCQASFRRSLTVWGNNRANRRTGETQYPGGDCSRGLIALCSSSSPGISDLRCGVFLKA